ncbi:MAG: PDGLE domain-containing protein [Thermoplasmata archaeon]|nr:MAG: PDGLE domain-containing protein [Thermoplasmata archaeon]
MKARTRKILAFGTLMAIIIAVAAPFLASDNPDGLESTAEDFESADDKESQAHDSPMPDYSIPALGENEYSGAIAIVLGTVITLLIVLGLFYGLTAGKKRSNKSEKVKAKGSDESNRS